jgi:hypothetical protein
MSRTTGLLAMATGLISFTVARVRVPAARLWRALRGEPAGVLGRVSERRGLPRPGWHLRVHAVTA